ncbi:MAG: pilus assembly protein TadG-related protein [Anaerolineales bacterium]
MPKTKFPEKGQALIIIVFSFIGLLGMAALAIDGGNAYLERRKTQSAADAAALSGAIARIKGNDWREYALASAKSNGYDNNGITNTVELNTPPTSGPYVDNPEYVQVIITSHINTFFGVVIGIPQIVVSTQAISQTKPAEYGQMFNGDALVSLAPESKCDVPNKRAFWLHDEATLTMVGGGIFVNSDNPDCAFIEQGSAGIRFLDDNSLVIVGGADIQKPQLILPTPPQTGAVPIIFPPPFQMPKITCGKSATVISGSGTIDANGLPINMTMSAGAWEGDFPPKGVNYLEGGIYCIRGDVLVDGLLSGTDVVLFVEEGNIHIQGSAEIQLSAPKIGPLQGLLIYLPIENLGRVALNGNFNSSYRGTILAPSAGIHLNGIESKEGYHSQIIGKYIEVGGIDNIKITYKDEQNYDAFKMPEVLLSD